MKHTRRSLLVTFLYLSVAACGGGESSAGGPSSATGLDAPDRNLTLATTPVYQVGGFDAPDWATFGAVTSVRFDAEGRLYILDSQAKQVTVVGTDGSFLGTIGSPGEGPGELSSPFGLALTTDGRVAVFDIGHQGFVVYDSEGEYIATTRVDMQEVGFPGREISPHPSGGIISGVGGRIRMEINGDVQAGPPSRPVAYFPLAGGEEGRVVYRAWDLPQAPESDTDLELAGGQSFTMRMPVERAFEPGLYTDVLPDGRLAVVDSVGYRVKLIDMDGRVVRTLERPILPTPVTGAIEERERDRRLAEMTEGGGPQMVIQFRTTGPGGGGGGQVASDAVRRMMEQRLESMVFAEEIPVIESMVADWEGRLWIQRNSGEPGEPGPTDIITIAGEYLGSLAPDGLRTPRAFGPDGLIVRIETDEFDVPTLVVERLPEDLYRATED